MPTTPAVNPNFQPNSIGPGNTPYISSQTPTTPTIPSTITSSSLAPTAPTTPVQPNTPPPYNIANLSVTTPPLTETPNQSQQSDLSKQLEDLINQEAGKAAYQTQQEKLAGIPGYQSTLADLGGQLKALQTQSQAIPLQDQTNAEGRGITAAGLAPIDSANLRNNAVQALNISAQIDATNGLLSSAQTKVTEAVNQQYGPIEAKIAALQANLKNIQNDPATTIQEKNQAQQQLDAVNAQKDQIAQAKQNATDIYNLAVSAASNIANFVPSQQYPTAAVAIQAIQNAPDKATALKIALDSGLTSSGVKSDTSVQEIGGEKFLIDNQTGKKISDLGSAATYAELHPSSSATSYSFTPTVKTSLAAAGETTASIKQLEADIGQYGAQMVLDQGLAQGTLSDATAKAIETAFNITPTPTPGQKNGLFGLGFLGL